MHTAFTMEATALNALHPLSEQGRRTNILLQELGRSTIPHTAEVRTSYIYNYKNLFSVTESQPQTTNLTHSYFQPSWITILYIVILDTI